MTLGDLLLENRIIFLEGVINDAVANLAVMKFLFLQYENRTQGISFYINSPGGSVSSTLAIYDTMQFIECPVATYCIGLAASGAAVLLAGGTKGRRFSLPHSKIMIHQPYGQVGGQVSDIEIQAEEIVKSRQVINEILARHTGQPIERIARDTERDRYLTAMQAKEYGLVDEVVGKIPGERKGRPGSSVTTAAPQHAAVDRKSGNAPDRIAELHRPPHRLPASFLEGLSPMPLVPIVIERSGREERAMDIYSRLLQDRIIILGTAIDDTVANLVVAQMLVLAHQDAKADIHLYINSPGGSVTAGLAIYDTMQWVPCDVATYCIGQCASMGSLLLAAGAKGKRNALPHSRIMIHQPLAGMEGTATEILIHAEEFIRMKKQLNADLPAAHRPDAREAPGRHRPRPLHGPRRGPRVRPDRQRRRSRSAVPGQSRADLTGRARG